MPLLLPSIAPIDSSSGPGHARRSSRRAQGDGRTILTRIGDDEAADAFRWFEPYGAGAPDAAGAASSIKEAGKRETRALL